MSFLLLHRTNTALNPLFYVKEMQMKLFAIFVVLMTSYFTYMIFA